MPRGPRNAPGGLVYHVLNRGVGRRTLFHKPADYDAFERVMGEALRRVPTMRLLAYCLMPNHWHQVVWPGGDADVTEYFRWLTHTHTQRYHAHYHSSGTGHLYQGRFKSFAVETDGHVLSVCRYVERNALRANLVDRAEDWRWSSLWRRRIAAAADVAGGVALGGGPVPLPDDWVEIVNAPQSDAELAALRQSVQRSSPFGSDAWRERTATLLGLQSTLRTKGRPRKMVEQLLRSEPAL